MIWLYLSTTHWGDNLVDTNNKGEHDLWTRFHFSGYPQWLVSYGWLPSGSLSLPAGLGPASGLDMPGTALALATSLSRQLVDIRTHLWRQPRTSPVSCQEDAGMPKMLRSCKLESQKKSSLCFVKLDNIIKILGGGREPFVFNLRILLIHLLL